MATQNTQSEKKGGRVFKGTVVKTAMKDTVTVLVKRFVSHKKYKKYMQFEKKFLVHDAGNTAKVGDIVLIQETRPISKSKNFILKETVTAASAQEE